MLIVSITTHADWILSDVDLQRFGCIAFRAVKATNINVRERGKRVNENK